MFPGREFSAGVIHGKLLKNNKQKQMFKRFKCDVAISVAEEDLKIAQRIAASLKKRKITYYLYDEQSAENWGRYLLEISLAKYGAEAKYILLIISKSFAEKYWTSIESQIIQVYKPGKEAYVLQLRLNDVAVDGFNKYMAFVKWENNEDDIAEKIKKKLRLRRQRAYKKRAGIFTSIIALLAVLYFLIPMAKPLPDYSKYLAFITQGDSLVQKNKFNEARDVYERALTYNPKDVAASRKLALLDSAARFVKENNYKSAEMLFQAIINIPASPGLSTAALDRAGVESNPPISIFIQWNGSVLEIKISGGVPFNNDKQPYLIVGIGCQDCIKWAKKDSNYIASVAADKVNIEKIQLKDRLGQFLYKSIPENTFSLTASDNSSPLQQTGSDKEHADPTKTGISKEEAYAGYMQAGDSLFVKEKYTEAKNEYLNARNINPADAVVARKIADCDNKINEAKEASAKSIPRVSIPAGSFIMGTDNGNPDDGPGHTVNISAFYMSKTEVTVAQYRNFCLFTNREMPPAPSYGWGDDYPIVNVTWNEATAYCEWVGGKLPAEAQWEYAAHANSNSLYSGGSQINSIAWYSNNASGKPGRVATKSPNGFGLYDMTGNVLEWCQDWYGRKYYSQAEKDNPAGPSSGNDKVIRGGAYNSFTNSTQDGNQLRITYRNSEVPSARKPYIGFRVAWNN